MICLLGFAERARVFVLVVMVVCDLLLLVPGALELLFPHWPNLMRLLCYGGSFSSLIFLVFTVVCPGRWSEIACELNFESERFAVDTVSCLVCSGCGRVWSRIWLRGDCVGKVVDRCLLCGSEYRVKSIYSREPRQNTE